MLPTIFMYVRKLPLLFLNTHFLGLLDLSDIYFMSDLFVNWTYVLMNNSAFL